MDMEKMINEINDDAMEEVSGGAIKESPTSSNEQGGNTVFQYDPLSERGRRPEFTRN